MISTQALEAAERARDSIALRAALCAGQIPPSALRRLLLEDWHDVHEDIVFSIDQSGDESAIGAIAQAVNIPFPHLIRWGNLHEFQRKCAFALVGIGTPSAHAALEVMASSADPFLRRYGEEGLFKW